MSGAHRPAARVARAAVAETRRRGREDWSRVLFCLRQGCGRSWRCLRSARSGRCRDPPPRSF